MSAKLIYFPKHKRMTWESLGGCSRCLGWEGEVPTHCPGVPMTQDQKNAVLSGKLDYFIHEGWTTCTVFDRHRVRTFLTEGRWI